MNFKKTIETWKKILNSVETEISLITTFDLPNQRIIQADADRTRVGTLTTEEKVDLEMLLTLYCKEHNLNYKQGMNEIMAPFLLLTREGLPLHEAYSMFKQFLHRVLGNVFVDSEFRPLQAMFLVFRLLVRYHEPRISSFLCFNKVPPECYLTNWILTAFASKVNNIEILFTLWTEVFLENDQFFLLYLSLALLQQFKSDIVQSNDIAIPLKITTLEISDSEICESILAKARRFKSNMPYSTLTELSKCNIYDLEYINSLIFQLEQQACLTVMGHEAIKRTFPDTKLCSCTKTQCLWCADPGKSVPFVLIDCRTAEIQEQGIIPNSILLNKNAYNNADDMLDFPDQFVSMRGIIHFCLMGGGSLQSNFNFTKRQDLDKTGKMMNNLIQAFLMKGFPYVSVLEGGYERMHDYASHFKLGFDRHKEKNCSLCSPVHSRRDIRSASAGDMIGQTHYIVNLKNNITQEPQVVGQEMHGYCHTIFFCEIQSGSSSLKFCLKICESWFNAVPSEKAGDVIKYPISSLKNLSILKKNSLTIKVSFENKEPLLVRMKSKEDVKKCVGELSIFYQKSIEKHNFNNHLK